MHTPTLDELAVYTVPQDEVVAHIFPSMVLGEVGGDKPTSAIPPLPQYRSLSDIHADLSELGRLRVDEAYRVKQLHKIPDAMEVDRTTVCVEAARDKRVLHLGCGWPPGPLHQAIAGVAAHLIGVDIAAPGGGREHIWQADLDTHPDGLPLRDYDLIVAGEILEHLGNPGNLLLALRRLFPAVMLIITVPNAFSAAGLEWVKRGYENCNREHTCWYSWKTLTELVTRCGYVVCNWGWYGGPPYVAEGIVFIVKPEGA